MESSDEKERKREMTLPLTLDSLIDLKGSVCLYASIGTPFPPP